MEGKWLRYELCLITEAVYGYLEQFAHLEQDFQFAAAASRHVDMARNVRTPTHPAYPRRDRQVGL
jgi:hypothetical protein